MELRSKFEKLIKKQLKYESSLLGLNLLIARLQRKYAANQTPAELKECVQEMEAFFEKHRHLVEKDIAALKRL